MLKLTKHPPQETPASNPFIESAVEKPLILQGFLRREQLAKELGVSPRTIDRWQHLRQGPPRLRMGRTVLYDAQSVREWLRSKEQHVPTANKIHTSAYKRNIHRHLPKS